MKVIVGEAKVMVSCGITKNGLSKGKVDPCGVCSLQVRANSVLCVQCGRWTHGRCASSEGDSNVFKEFCMQKMCGEYWRGSGAEDKLCDEVETVR